MIVRDVDPVIPLKLSVAEMVCNPAVVKVAVNVPTPFTKVESAGKVPAEEDVK